MTTAGVKLFERKSLYHSNLVYYTGDNPDGLPCQLTTSVIASKDGGKIVKIQPMGDPDDYWVKLENEVVESAFASVPKDTWVTLQAYGSRDAATVAITGADGTVFAASGASEDTAGPAFSPPPPSFTPTPTPKLVTTTMASPVVAAPTFTPPQPRDAAADMVDALVRANSVMVKYQQATGKELDEHTRALGVSLFIEGNR
tara:strand:- start:3399 stop:3998 length:600 start_codon:yes stop_codon:yes gene_type:complete